MPGGVGSKRDGFQQSLQHLDVGDSHGKNISPNKVKFGDTWGETPSNRGPSRRGILKPSSVSVSPEISVEKNLGDERRTPSKFQERRDRQKDMDKNRDKYESPTKVAGD